MVAIFISTFMTSVETTIITTALPTIISRLNGLSVQSWVFSTYLLTTALSTPIYGKFADRIGRKPIYIIGLILFTLGSLLCGFADNIYVLIFSRALQGLGAGAIMPITFTIIADLFTYENRFFMLALNNTAWGISALLGPLLGGFIVDRLNWHWVFFINVPLGVAVLVTILIGYHENVRTNVKKPVDFKGIFALTLLLLFVLLLFQGLGQTHINWLVSMIELIATVGLIGIFFRAEKQAEDPIIPLTLFKNKIFTIQILTALLLSGIQIGFQTYFPMWLQAIYRASASVAGLAVTPSPVLWLVASFFVGTLVKRWAPKRIAIPIITIQALFYVPLIFAGTSFPQFMFYVIAGITGISLGITITMNTLISQRVVPEQNLGTASSMLTLGRTLGQTIATGIFGLIFNIAINTKLKNYAVIKLSTVNHYINAGNKTMPSAVSTDLNTIILSGMHAVFFAVLIIFVVVIGLNLSDRNTDVIK
ncbi:MFS transporter [Pediococcus pentosaceus]|uniref:MFS transporter n=1 Tax=Pediococcus pentosaceus TaxID=1255 RepID=UPI0023B03528|nr:MFS transporter [Pediococcus pentosaceus]MDE7512280.1 MFS transporter [Pediococcus pentosaceus]